MKSNGITRTADAGRRALVLYLSALVLAAGLAASLVAAPAPSRAQAQGGEAKPAQLKLGVKQRDKKTELKLVAERGELTKATATDSAGTRSLKRIDKLTIPCTEEQMVCKTVELENGVLVGVCYCPDTQTALLVPAIQAAREAARSTDANTNSGGSTGLTKVGPGTLTLSGANAAQKQRCWGDEKLQLVVCPQ